MKEVQIIDKGSKHYLTVGKVVSENDTYYNVKLSPILTIQFKKESVREL